MCMGSRVCICNFQCTDGEVCSGLPGASYCFSPRLIERLGWANTLPCVINPRFTPEVEVPPDTNTPAPTPKDVPGLTGARCNNDNNCRRPRKCIQGGGGSCIAGYALCDKEEKSCQPGDRDCYCYQLDRCSCSDDCMAPEICVATTEGRVCVSKKLLPLSQYLIEITCPRGKNPPGPILVVKLPQPYPPIRSKPSAKATPSNSRKPNLSKTPRPTPTRKPRISPEAGGGNALGGGDGEGACVDARLVRHFAHHELVFERHVLRRVLCDEHDSCATAGHLVVYKGNPMMMRSYCLAVGCDMKVIHVNSPRLTRALRIASNTKQLEFTTFAARFETRAEERILSIAIRVGL